MKLEIAEFPVSKIRLGHRFSYEIKFSMSTKAR